MLVHLVNAKLPRIAPYAIGCLDFVMLAAALTAGMFVGLADIHLQWPHPPPWREALLLTAALTWTTAYVLALCGH